MLDKKIQFKNVTKKIRRNTILNDVSFNVYKGDICGFVGPNGAGKTTLIKALTNLIGVTSGEINIDGLNVQLNREDILRKLGAIVEEPIFFSYMTGKQNLMNLAMLNPNMCKNEQIEKVEEVLKIVDLKDRGDDKVKTYSLGMKQRLGVAQTLLNNPEIIVLDEPANGLDPIGMKDLRQLILKLNKEKNVTFFISSHLLDELCKICNRFIAINSGQIVWEGSKEEIMKKTEKSGDLEDAFINLVSNY